MQSITMPNADFHTRTQNLLTVLEETATTCRYLITADPLEQLSRRDRRRLRRG